MEKKNKKMMIDEDLFRMMYQYFIYDREEVGWSFSGTFV